MMMCLAFFVIIIHFDRMPHGTRFIFATNQELIIGDDYGKRN